MALQMDDNDQRGAKETRGSSCETEEDGNKPTYCVTDVPPWYLCILLAIQVSQGTLHVCFCLSLQLHIAPQGKETARFIYVFVFSCVINAVDSSSLVPLPCSIT